MIKLLATGIGMASLMAGVAFVAMWLRRQLTARVGGVDPRCLEVIARVGLQTNQGVAVVRVGQRLLLVSSGDGGVRTLAELSEDDLPGLGPLAGPGPAVPLKLHRAGPGRTRAVLSRLLLVVVGLWAAPAGLVAQETTQSQAATEMEALMESLPPVTVQLGDDEEGLRLSGTVGTVIVLGLLSLAPSLLLLTTAFTRILIVLHLMRQALGTQNTPPGHLLSGLAILLTTAVMAPTLEQVRVEAVDPWMAGEIEEGVMLERAVGPMREFMLSHTRESDLGTFLDISQASTPETPDDISNIVLMSAFVTSELRTAFEIGFAIFLPFIVIDLVVAAVLTSMGMFMLPPTMIALPCKLMLFVLMDGWALLLGSLAQSFL